MLLFLVWSSLVVAIQAQNVGFTKLLTCNFDYALPLSFYTNNKQYNVNVLLDTGSPLFALNTKGCQGCPKSNIPSPNGGEIINMSYDSGTGFTGYLANASVTLPGTSLRYQTPWIGMFKSSKHDEFCGITLDGIAGFTAGPSNASLIKSFIKSTKPSGIPSSFAIQTCGTTSSTLGKPQANMYFGGYPSKIVDKVNWYPIKKKKVAQVWTFPAQSMLIGGKNIGVDVSPYNVVFDSGWGSNFYAVSQVGVPMLKAFKESGGIVFNPNVSQSTISSFWKGKEVKVSPKLYKIYPDKLSISLIAPNISSPVVIPGSNLISISGNSIRFIPTVSYDPRFTAVHFGQVAFLGKLIVHDDGDELRIGFGNLTSNCNNLGASDINVFVGNYTANASTTTLTKKPKATN